MICILCRHVLGMHAKVVQNDAKSFASCCTDNSDMMTDFQTFVNSSYDDFRDDRTYKW